MNACALFMYKGWCYSNYWDLKCGLGRIFASVAVTSAVTCFTTLHWNLSRLFLDRVRTDCRLDGLQSAKWLWCLLSVHSIGFSFSAQYVEKHRHHTSINQDLSLKAKPDKRPSDLNFSYFWPVWTNTSFGPWAQTGAYLHWHYTKFVAKCILDQLQM